MDDDGDSVSLRRLTTFLCMGWISLLMAWGHGSSISSYNVSVCLVDQLFHGQGIASLHIILQILCLWGGSIFLMDGVYIVHNFCPNSCTM